MGSSRFPGKPMAKIHDKPMIGHVYDNVRRCELIHKTVVATCDEEIAGYIRSINGHAVMTSSSHERASDRCAEALKYIEQEDNIRYDIVVMVQGDEPMTHPDMISEAVTPMLHDSKIIVTNLDGPLKHLKNEWEFQEINNTTQLQFFVDFELKNPILNGIMKKSFEIGLNKIAKAFEERAMKLFK